MKRLIPLCLLAITLSSCGLFGSGESSDNNGKTEVSIDSSVVSFDASRGQDAYQALKISNPTDQPVILTGVEFENNRCASFGLFNITNLNGVILSNRSTQFNIPLGVGEAVRVNVRFHPESCPYANYETTLYVYFNEGSATNDGQLRTSVRLRSSGLAPNRGGETTICEDPGVEYEYTPLSVSSVPPAGQYFLRVDRMRAFIFPGGGADDQRTMIGTDIGEIDPTAFAPPHLPVTVSGNGTLTLSEISLCDSFVVPSAPTDRFFQGSPTVLTSNTELSGRFSRDLATRITDITLEGLRIKLRAEDIGGDSIIDDPNTEIFQISMETDLTTGETAYSPFLGVPLRTMELYIADNDILNVECRPNDECRLYGEPLVDGTMTLVGIGSFDNIENTYIGDTTPKSFLITNPASIFIQLQVTLTEREEVSNE